MLCIARTMPSQDVCPSVTRRHCVKTVEHILKLCIARRLGTPFCFFFHIPNVMAISDGHSLTGASNAMKRSRFLTNISICLGNGTRYDHRYCGMWIGNRAQAFEWYLTKRTSYVVFLSVVWVALKRTGFGVSEVALSRFVWLNHSRCSKWRPFVFTHAHSHVCHWLRRWCLEEYSPRCQWASASARQCRVTVLCNVR